MTSGPTPRNLAHAILEDSRPPHALGPEVWQLADLLRQHATVRLRPRVDPRGQTETGQGLALSPTMAARCADDIARTVAFSRGVHQALRATRSLGIDRPARLLYAGCGPYALLALLSMTSFRPDELQVTLLDLHEPSIDSARAVIGAFGLEDRVEGYVTADACSYTFPSERMPDVILTETMNAALKGEPQVAIARHLMRQAPDALLVPERVHVDAILVDRGREFRFTENAAGVSEATERDHVPLGRVFELNRETIRQWEGISEDRLPAAALRLPDPLEPRYAPTYHTTVVAYGDHILHAYDSGLTLPRRIPIDASLRGGETLSFCYHLGSEPGLVCEVSRE